MENLLKTLFFSLLTFVVSFQAVSQNVKINELMSSNKDMLFDEDGDSPDWIELYNYGNSPVNLADYYISDSNSDLFKWHLPDVVLQENETFLIFASGKDRRPDRIYWHSVIDKGDIWKYIIPEEEPPSNWKSIAFDDRQWESGATGIGYGDNDDETVIDKNTLSVFMRKTITITNVDSIQSLWFHIDFDDAFVAYLNGTEIARFGIGKKGEPVAFDKTADLLHEAEIVKGKLPESYDITKFLHLLTNGENTLAVQVHNIEKNSSDFSAIPFLTLGYSSDTGLSTPVSKYIELPKDEAHSNFKLSASGETVFLTDKNGVIADSISFGVIPGRYSLGRNKKIIENWVLFANPSPGKPNEISTITGVVSDSVHFSIPQMFLAEAQNLVLSGANSGEDIHFTTNGTEPTLASPVYETPIPISKNSIVRARIFKPGFVPGKMASRTYLFDAQPTLPVVSVITDPDNLWNTETGIYVMGEDASEDIPYFGANFWEDWEKPANIEMIKTDGERLFSLNCGIKIFGNWSRAKAQKSLSVFFRNEYGDPELTGVQLFKSKEITKFKSLVLRNSGNDFEYSKMRDGMMTSLVRNLNIDRAAYQPTILYLNGKYWGIINLRERINKDFLEENYGIKAEDVDILERNSIVLKGSSENYSDLIWFIKTNNLSKIEVYQKVCAQMDISNYIDYLISEIYFNNRDWPGNNIKFWRPQTEEGKWRWILFDTDFGFGIWNGSDYKLNTLKFALATNGQSWPNPPWSTFLFRKLLENETFKNQFINRFADLLNTTFLPANVISHIDSLHDAIEPEIEQNFEKWNKPSVYTWNSQIQRMITFATNRPHYNREHIKEQFSIPQNYKIKLSILPSVAGVVDLNSLTITKPNWEGEYFENIPVSLTAHARSGYKFHSWVVDNVVMTNKTIQVNIKNATTIRAIFEDAGEMDNSVVFNEINYNSSEESNAGDWVELFNWGDYDVDISGWIFKDNDDSHEFKIPENTVLKSNEYLVLCRKEDKFSTQYSEVKNYIGDFSFGLGSDGDAVRLFDRFGKLIDEVAFSATQPWPDEPNGGGRTLELRHYYNDNSNAESWKSSLVKAGTPGAENSITTNSEWIASVSSKKVLNVYPNPFTSETRIKVENNIHNSITVYIYSLDGREVLNKVSLGNEFVWRGENSAGQKLEAGIYICKVKSGNTVLTSKIILNR